MKPNVNLQDLTQLSVGRERFVDDLKPLLQERAPTKEIPRKERLVTRPGLEELFGGIKPFVFTGTPSKR